MNLAVIGLGFMGATHLKAIQRIAGVRLAAVVSNSEAKLAGDLSGIAGNLGGPGERMDFSQTKKYRTPAEALRDTEIDAVDICLPTALHAPVALEAMRMGKHVLVEKPMALDGRAAGEMIEVAQKAGRVLMCAQVLRFFPAYRKLAEILDGGALGPVLGATFRRRCATPGWGAWLPDKSQSGGGVFDLLIHDVDMCLRLFGKPAAVSATGHEDLARGVDLINAQLHYARIGSVTIAGGWHHPDFPFSMEYTVVAEGGTVEYSSAGRTPTLYRAGQPAEVFEDPPDYDAYQAQIEYFIECCRSGRAPVLCPPEESAAAIWLTRFMEEARTRKGERIECRL